MNFNYFETKEEKGKEIDEKLKEVLNEVIDCFYDCDFGEIDLIIRELIKYKRNNYELQEELK